MYISPTFKQLLVRQIPHRFYSACFIKNNLEQKHQNKCYNLTSQSVYTIQAHNFSLQATIESIVRTQSGIFKSISESTPVGYVQDFIVSVHTHTGLPWWASIVFTTILLRSCITLPLGIHQNYIMAKIENLKLEMPEIVKNLKLETTVAIRKFNWNEAQTKIVFNRSLKKQWNALIVRDNCHPFKASLLLWVQLPMWVFFSVSLRNLTFMLPKRDLDATLTFIELTIGGTAWIPNLTLPDSSLILPVTLGLVNLLIIEIQSMTKVATPSKLQRYATNLFRGVSLVMIPIAASVPSCMCVYWVTSSTCGLIHNLILMSPKFKRLTGIPKTSIELQNPYLSVLEKFRTKYKLK